LPVNVQYRCASLFAASSISNISLSRVICVGLSSADWSDHADCRSVVDAGVTIIGISESS
jgi:hypothetical protein